MTVSAYRYVFEKGVDMNEAEATMILAMLAVESLHGQSAIRMDVRYKFDPKRRVCEIDAGSEVGQDLNKLYAGFISREFGPRAYSVERVPDSPVAA